MTFDVTTEALNALRVLVVERDSDQEPGSGGINKTYCA